MDWKDDEVNRRLNNGNGPSCGAAAAMREADAIRRDIEREERSRILEEENNVVLKKQLSEVLRANQILEKQNKELKETNEKLEIQIDDFRKEARSSKKQSLISIIIAACSLALAVISIILTVVLKR